MSSHRVAVLIYNGMAPFELGVVAEVFALPRPELEVRWWYEFDVCSVDGRPIRAVGDFYIRAMHRLDTLASADTVIALGTEDVEDDPSPEVVAAFRAAYDGGARIVSVCSGAFVLAAAGILAGRRAATHWRYAPILARRYPDVDVDSRSLYVIDGRVLTSAGTAAGIDLCLHVIRSDHGSAVANRVARRMVVAPHREGGQAQFIERPLPPAPADKVTTVISDAANDPAQDRSVPAMAAAAHLSVRQFSRRFKTATGQSPSRWLVDQRIQASRELLETSDEPIEVIAGRVGFTSAAAFRKHFRRVTALSPNAYRDAFAQGVIREKI